MHCIYCIANVYNMIIIIADGRLLGWGGGGLGG